MLSWCFSGGIPIGLVGQYLNTVQSAKMILEDASMSPVKRYTSVSNCLEESQLRGPVFWISNQVWHNRAVLPQKV